MFFFVLYTSEVSCVWWWKVRCSVLKDFDVNISKQPDILTFSLCQKRLVYGDWYNPRHLKSSWNMTYLSLVSCGSAKIWTNPPPYARQITAPRPPTKKKKTSCISTRNLVAGTKEKLQLSNFSSIYYLLAATLVLQSSNTTVNTDYILGSCHRTKKCTVCCGLQTRNLLSDHVK